MEIIILSLQKYIFMVVAPFLFSKSKKCWNAFSARGRPLAGHIMNWPGCGGMWPATGRPLADWKKCRKNYKSARIPSNKCRMITKLSIKLLQIIMYPQLKWYTKICFCGNRTLVQMLLSDKFQKGCNAILAENHFRATKGVFLRTCCVDLCAAKNFSNSY